MNRALVAALGLGVLAEVLRRPAARRELVPAQVSEQAAAVLRQMDLDPCTGERGSPRGYTELYLAQKATLQRKYGSAMEYLCGRTGFAPCIPLIVKSIPTPPIGCTIEVCTQWIDAARSVAASGATGLLKGDLELLANALQTHRGLVKGELEVLGAAAKPRAETNRRVWSVIGQIALDLQGVYFNHGDTEGEAWDELVDTVASPSSYVGVAADAGGAIASGAAQIGGEAFGRLVGSNLGAIAITAGAVYLVTR